jgi:hypothetical protein
VKRKPARKPAKKWRAAEVRGIPLPGGQIQGTLFPVVLRPDAEVRAEQDGEVLEGGIPAVVLDQLETQARAILEDVQRWKMDHSTKPHRYSWGPGKKHHYTAEESVLGDLVKKIAAAAFKIAADRYRPEIAALVARLKQQTRLLEQRRENGQILAEEGRAARKPKTDRRADRICKLYRRIRPAHPPGKRGNGAAVAEVARRHGPLPGKEKPITTTAVRKTLKRCGVPCR